MSEIITNMLADGKKMKNQTEQEKIAQKLKSVEIWADCKGAEATQTELLEIIALEIATLVDEIRDLKNNVRTQE